MKFHRHAQHLIREGMKPEEPRGYMFCDLCNCKPTIGSAGDRQPYCIEVKEKAPGEGGLDASEKPADGDEAP